MITVLVAAEKQDKDFWNALSRLLGKYFATVRAYGQKLVLCKESPRLLLCDMQSFKAIDAERLIIVYKEPQPLTAKLKSAGNAVAVVDSSNDNLLEFVSSTHFPAITCGMLSRDTVTLSSMDVDSAVIDIRRPITCFDGTKAEPQEIPLRFAKPIDSFVLMTVAAVLILSGNIGLLSKGRM